MICVRCKRESEDEYDKNHARFYRKCKKCRKESEKMNKAVCDFEGDTCRKLIKGTPLWDAWEARIRKMIAIHERNLREGTEYPLQNVRLRDMK